MSQRGRKHRQAVVGLVVAADPPRMFNPARREPRDRSPASVSATTSPATPPIANYDWTTFGFDNERSGIDPNEVVLDVDSAPTLQVSWSTSSVER